MKLFICQTLIRPIHTYSAFVHGVIHQWNYIMHTFSSFSTLGWCQPSVILIHFLTGQAPCSQLECQLFSLPCHFDGLNLLNPAPCHFDGLNLLNPASMCDQFNSSQRISGLSKDKWPLSFYSLTIEAVSYSLSSSH